MIQFNLLPDVKLEYVKAQRTKRTVVGGALIATGATFALFLLLFLTVHVVQKKSMNDLDKDIKEYSAELKGTKDLDKILTIQSQLGSLSPLHDQKAVSSRIFSLMQQVTPASVTINELTMDYAQGTINITGQAPGLNWVNTFADTLKFSTFTTPETQSQKAFTEVVMSQFSRNTTDTTYTLTAKLNATLFSSAGDITLNVPKTETTRSIVEQPKPIFRASEAETNNKADR